MAVTLLAWWQLGGKSYDERTRTNNCQHNITRRGTDVRYLLSQEASLEFQAAMKDLLTATRGNVPSLIHRKSCEGNSSISFLVMWNRGNSRAVENSGIIT